MGVRVQLGPTRSPPYCEGSLNKNAAGVQIHDTPCWAPKCLWHSTLPADLSHFHRTVVLISIASRGVYIRFFGSLITLA